MIMPAGTLPPVDFAVLEAQTFGDPALATEVLRLFLAQAERLLPELPDLPPARQGESAHRLKGSCQGIGAKGLADLLQRYDDADRDGRAALQQSLASAFAEARAAILARLGTA